MAGYGNEKSLFKLDSNQAVTWYLVLKDLICELIIITYAKFGFTAYS